MSTHHGAGCSLAASPSARAAPISSFSVIDRTQKQEEQTDCRYPNDCAVLLLFCCTASCVRGREQEISRNGFVVSGHVSEQHGLFVWGKKTESPQMPIRLCKNLRV
ncbi:hypothetical protein BaRGS_00000428 [Batillaria attramentaria]|uniref:Secreted protein n=1 Tax=Batillaria attramentaria TaxID=370345 RepID=A0ABD0M8N3_9CAEN